MNYVDVNCFLCGKQYLDVNSSVKNKDYYFNRMYYINKGEALYKDSQSEILLQEGHIYLLPVNKYSIMHTSKKIFEHTWFHLSIKSLCIRDVIDYDLLNHPIIKKYIELLSLHVEANLNAENIVEIDSSVFSLINLILQSLFTYFHSTDAFSSTFSPQIKKVRMYINENIDMDLSNDILARVCNYNKYYFIKLFTKQCNMSPQKYVLSVRMNQAKTMLSNHISIVKISNTLGYLDPKSFTRAFKREVGVSPRQFNAIQNRINASDGCVMNNNLYI